MKWWESCDHNWIEIQRSKIPGIEFTEINARGKCTEALVESMHDRTAIMLRCSRCGDRIGRTLRGWFPKPVTVEKSQSEQAAMQSEAKPL
jgi:hypothetical protein